MNDLAEWLSQNNYCPIKGLIKNNIQAIFYKDSN